MQTSRRGKESRPHSGASDSASTLPLDPIPAAGFEPTQWCAPPTGDMDLIVQFRNGYVDRKNTYKARQLRWNNTGHAWDIIAVRAAV